MARLDPRPLEDFSIPTGRAFLNESEAVKVTIDWLQQPE